jgi:hypothetical protein
MEQPQLFTIPVVTLTRIVNYLGDRPFSEVAAIMMMIEQTVKAMETEGGTVQRPRRQRSGRKSQPKR